MSASPLRERNEMKVRSGRSSGWVVEIRPREREHPDYDPVCHGCCFRENSPEMEEVGYLDCWMCEKTFRNNDFQKHYKEYHVATRKPCGLRPPTHCNDLYGHCGKKIKGEWYVCKEDDAYCCTVCCSECFSL